MFAPVIALLQFTTIIPLGKTAPFEAFARNTWLYPFAGYITGGCGALLLLLFPAPPMIGAAISIGLILFITGCNHLDGLMDLGDGLMAHGSREKRINALCDRTIGTGGIALGMMVTMTSVIALGSIPFAWVGLIIAEVGGKWSMSLLTMTGKPFHEGLHATLHSQAKPWFLIPATLLIIPTLLFPLPHTIIAGSFVVMVLIPLFLRSTAYRLFGGVNGDVTGSSGEITRAAILILMAYTMG